jgi:hypothetical protein
MQPKDPGHWLYRFSPDEWLRAADHELVRAEHALAAKQQRAGVAGARRAAGMAWNAVLALADSPDDRFGRSYMDHIAALAKDSSVDEHVRGAARQLLDAPLQTNLVPLGKGDTHLADSVRLILAAARTRVTGN